MSDRMTAKDVETKDFKKTMRGYDADDVRLYLRAVGEELSRLALENQELREKTSRLDREVDDLRARERTLQETLVSAQRMADDLKDQARAEAEVTIKEARLRSERLLEQAQDQLGRIEDEIRRARLERDAFESRVRTSIEEHLALLEMRRSERAETDNLHFMHRKSAPQAGTETG